MPFQVSLALYIFILEGNVKNTPKVTLSFIFFTCEDIVACYKTRK